LVAGYDASATAGEPQAFLLVLLVVGGLNTFLSLFYYVRVIKIMTFDEEPEQRRMVSLPILSPQGLYLCLLTAPTVLLILRWDILSRWALAAAQFLVA
jgi:NADH-quinone oxidoreductase subunit N